MSTARWEQVKSLFHAAMELPASERAVFLETQCKGDAALRREVESLLKSAGSAVVKTGGAAQALGLDGTVGNTRSTMTHFVPITETAGTVIGPYKLLQVIGEGGFGTVFLAEQHQPVRRRVALKIIKLGMDTKSVVARFEAERQALALMEHPHIARVLDGGATDTGRPYFVMEYVVGDSITKFADAHSLTVNERLDLFQQVCSAVQHAHTKGIIHRDLKPGNVLVSMVDGKPFAKVIDFGIAKATAGVGGALTDKTLFTEHKLLIGTPEYMSPEQAEGSMDIDTRTDVYSLGVLLYELLTGTTPIDSTKLRSAAYDEMRRMIREDDPPMPSMKLSRSLDKLAATAAARKIEPSKLSTIVKGELDWIVMKALEKERGRRYETANALGDDVRRHLLGEAVVAAPVSKAYRLRKFVLRNRGSVAAISAVMLALVAGGSVAVWQWQKYKNLNDKIFGTLTFVNTILNEGTEYNYSEHKWTARELKWRRNLSANPVTAAEAVATLANLAVSERDDALAKAAELKAANAELIEREKMVTESLQEISNAAITPELKGGGAVSVGHPDGATASRKEELALLIDSAKKAISDLRQQRDNATSVVVDIAKSFGRHDLALARADGMNFEPNEPFLMAGGAGGRIEISAENDDVRVRITKLEPDGTRTTTDGAEALDTIAFLANRALEGTAAAQVRLVEANRTLQQEALQSRRAELQTRLLLVRNWGETWWNGVLTQMQACREAELLISLGRPREALVMSSAFELGGFGPGYKEDVATGREGSIGDTGNRYWYSISLFASRGCAKALLGRIEEAAAIRGQLAGLSFDEVDGGWPSKEDAEWVDKARQGFEGQKAEALRQLDHVIDIAPQLRKLADERRRDDAANSTADIQAESDLSIDDRVMLEGFVAETDDSSRQARWERVLPNVQRASDDLHDKKPTLATLQTFRDAALILPEVASVHRRLALTHIALLRNGCSPDMLRPSYSEALIAAIQAIRIDEQSKTGVTPASWSVLAITRLAISQADVGAIASINQFDAKADSLSGGKILTSEEHRDAAVESLAKARALMQPAADGTPSPWAEDADAKALIAEAEALIEK